MRDAVTDVIVLDAVNLSKGFLEANRLLLELTTILIAIAKGRFKALLILNYFGE